MTKIKDINTALNCFAEAANIQAEATEKGDYKTGNKSYDIITKAVTFLKNSNALERLRDLLSNPSVGVRLWAAGYLLRINDRQAVNVLEEIVQMPGIHSLTAETTLSEWKKGKFKSWLISE